MSEARELLGVAEDELQLEPCPVNVEDVTGGKSQIRREEYLPGLSLFVRIKVVHDDNADFTTKADRSHVRSIQFVDNLVIRSVFFPEDAHVKVLEIDFPGEFLRPSSLPDLRSTIEILQVNIIAKAAYDNEAQHLDAGDKALLGEVGGKS